MEKILVLDVAADSGGAMSVLKDYYERLSADRDNRYLFAVSVAELADTDTVAVRRFPWVKKSWLHRLWFEHVTVGRLLRQEEIDRVLSLQNTGVTRAGCPQTIFLHQSLPFCGVSFSLFKQPKLWVYQHLIARRIYRSLKAADRVIVQTGWMRNAVCDKCGISPDKVAIESPVVTAAPDVLFDKAAWQRTFFFPAAAYVYKNHELILQAMELLADEGIADYTVRFTLKPEELPCIARYPRAARQVVFGGAVPYEQIMAVYAASVLVFPSYIETVGLPLLEAKMCGAPILASDCPFSHEFLDDYGDARFFDPFDPAALAAHMKAILEENP